MAKVKHTARKTSIGLTPAHHPYVCTECQRELASVANFRRHMIAQHGKKPDGSAADEATIERYKKRTGGSARAKPTAKTGADRPAPFASTTPTDEPTPFTSAMATTSRPKRLPTKSTTASSSAFSVSIAKDLEISSSTDDSSNELFIDITDEEPDKPVVESRPTVLSPTERKPTRPTPVLTPRVRVAKREAPPVVQPPLATAPTVKRRRLELAPSVLAQRVIENPRRTSRDLVSDLASRYSWTPVEQRDRVNVVRGMRAMAAAFSARIRRRLPLNRTDADVQRFLTVVEDECQLMEGHVSDEFSG